MSPQRLEANVETGLLLSRSFSLHPWYFFLSPFTFFCLLLLCFLHLHELICIEIVPLPTCFLPLSWEMRSVSFVFSPWILNSAVHIACLGNKLGGMDMQLQWKRLLLDGGLLKSEVCVHYSRYVYGSLQHCVSTLHLYDIRVTHR